MEDEKKTRLLPVENQKGSILITVTVILTVILLLSTALFTAAVSANKQAAVSIMRTKAYYAARSGAAAATQNISYFMNDISTLQGKPLTGTMEGDAGSYTVTITATETDITITSVGDYKGEKARIVARYEKGEISNNVRGHRPFDYSMYILPKPEDYESRTAIKNSTIYGNIYVGVSDLDIYNMNVYGTVKSGGNVYFSGTVSILSTEYNGLIYDGNLYAKGNIPELNNKTVISGEAVGQMQFDTQDIFGYDGFDTSTLVNPIWSWSTDPAVLTAVNNTQRSFNAGDTINASCTVTSSSFSNKSTAYINTEAGDVHIRLISDINMPVDSKIVVIGSNRVFIYLDNAGITMANGARIINQADYSAPFATPPSAPPSVYIISTGANSTNEFVDMANSRVDGFICLADAYYTNRGSDSTVNGNLISRHINYNNAEYNADNDIKNLKIVYHRPNLKDTIVQDWVTIPTETGGGSTLIGWVFVGYSDK